MSPAAGHLGRAGPVPIRTQGVALAHELLHECPTDHKWPCHDSLRPLELVQRRAYPLSPIPFRLSPEYALVLRALRPPEDSSQVQNRCKPFEEKGALKKDIYWPRGAQDDSETSGKHELIMELSV